MSKYTQEELDEAWQALGAPGCPYVVLNFAPVPEPLPKPIDYRPLAAIIESLEKKMAAKNNSLIKSFLYLIPPN